MLVTPASSPAGPAASRRQSYGHFAGAQVAHDCRDATAPSKLKAEEIVLAKMSGIAADMPPAPVPYKTAAPTEFDTKLPRPENAARLDVVNTATTADERRIRNCCSISKV